VEKVDKKIRFDEQPLKDFFIQQADIDFVLIFGSTALRRDTPLSDIDIAICFKREDDVLILGERQIDITCAMMRICKINRVDVVVLNCANPFLRYQVIKYGRLIYARDLRVFYKFKAASLGRYQDIRPMYELYDRVAEINLRRGVNG
jgi:predicted nucleotidyltransferase